MADRKITVVLAGSAAGLVKTFDEAEAAAKKSAGGMASAFNDGTTKIGNMLQRFGSSLSSWGVPFAGSLTKMGDQMAAAETKGQKLSSGIQAAGKLTAIAGVTGFAIAGAESVKMASSFQKSMELLVTAGGESQSNLSGIESGIMGIARSTGTSTSQLADGMYTLEKAGFRGSNGLNVLKMAAQGAKAENVDLGTMTNALTSIMSSYHIPASQAVNVTNELVAASGQSKTSMQEFAGSLSTVLPIASSVGLSFAQVGGAIATLTQHGTSADESTQELKNAIVQLTKPSQVAQSEMQQLGLNVNDVEKNLGTRGLTGTLNMVVQAITSHMGPAGLVLMNSFKESQSASADLKQMLGSMSPNLRDLSQQFLNGSIGMKAYRTDIRNMGAAGYAQGAQFLSLADKAKGFNDVLKSGSPAAQTFDAALKTVMGGQEGLSTALMLTGGSAGMFASKVQDVSDAASKGGQNISTWGATQSTLSVQMDKLKQNVQTLALSFGMWLIPMLEAVGKVASSVIGWLEKHSTVAKVLAGIIGGILVGAIGAWIVAMLSATVTIGSFEIAAAPLILIVGAIVAAVAGLVIGIVELVKHWKQVWGDIKQWASDAWHFIYDGWGKYLLIFLGPAGLLVLGIMEVSKHWSQIWGAIKDALSGAWSGMKGIFGDIVSFVEGMPGKIAKAAEGMWHGIKDAFRDAIDWIIRGWNSLHFKMPEINTHIPGIGKIGGFDIGLPQIPLLAAGGIITAPMLAVLGEAGPEAVIPLSQMRNELPPRGAATVGGVTVNITHSETIHGGADPTTVAQWKKLQDEHDQDLLRMLGQVA